MSIINKGTLLLLFLCVVHSKGNAKDIYATSVHYNDVKDAVSEAKQGDIVHLPSGIADWGNKGLTIPGGIQLVGSGSQNTIIRRTEATYDFVITFDCTNGFPNELHNIGFEGFFDITQTNGNNTINTKGVFLANGCTDFKVSGCSFEGFADVGLQIGNSNYQRGVIYNNQFINNYYAEAKPKLGYGIAVYGDKTSRPSLELGTENAVFVEDNFFLGNRHHIASNNSSKYVFRNNRAEHTYEVRNFAMIDAHGYRNSALTGSTSYEIYDNDLVYEPNTSDKARSAVGIRGGDGVIFGNTVSEKIIRTVELWVELSSQCGKPTIPGRINALHIWNNEHNDDLYGNWAIFRDSITLKQGISVTCPTSIVKDQHYFLSPLNNYEPYTYPHPLRNQNNLGNPNAIKIQAEDFITQQGIRLVNTVEGKAIGYLQPGDSASYSIYTTAEGMYTIKINFATAIPHGKITFSSNGTYLGEIKAPNTGGWSNYQVLSTTVSLPTGLQELKLDFSNAPYIGNIDWIEIEQLANQPSFKTNIEKDNKILLFPNPVKNGRISLFSDEEVLAVSVIDINGKVVIETQAKISNIDVSTLDEGLYLLKAITEEGTFVNKMIIE